MVLAKFCVVIYLAP